MGMSWSELGDKLISGAKAKNVPLIGQFELTPRCNLSCSMCYICRQANDQNAIEAEYSAKSWLELAKAARDAGMLYLLLTGGEVFLRNDFRMIYEEISMMGFNIEIYTNATLITPEIAKWLGKIPPSKIGVTMYGACYETYEHVTGNGPAYSNAVRGIDLLLEENITVALKTTVIRKNINDFEKLSDFALKRGIGLNVVSYISPLHQQGSQQPKNERLSPKELVAFENFIKNITEPDEITWDLSKSDSILNRTYTKGNCDDLSVSIEKPFDCCAGKCSFWVSWDGYMTPCGLMRTPATYPFKDGFARAWSSLLECYSTQKYFTECEPCNLKDFCSTCPAMIESESGTYTSKAPYFCEIAELRRKMKL